MQSGRRTERKCDLRKVCKGTPKRVGLRWGRWARHKGRVQQLVLLSGTDGSEQEAHNLMKSITIRAQFVVEELYSGDNTYNNKSYLPVRERKCDT